jgi:hypothetical protein
MIFGRKLIYLHSQEKRNAKVNNQGSAGLKGEATIDGGVGDNAGGSSSV